MRGAGFGLLGLLVVAGIVFWISFGPLGGGAKTGYVGTVLTKGKEAREQAGQISGHDENGVPVSESIKVDPVEIDGHFRRLKVVSVVPGGPFDTAFKLKAGDEVSEIGGLGVDMNDDFGLAQARLFESIQRVEPVTVIRDGRKLTLAPETALSDFHPEMFGKPTPTPAVPSH